MRHLRTFKQEDVFEGEHHAVVFHNALLETRVRTVDEGTNLRRLSFISFMN
jgi:hypothetical protein